jgi:hypothetical protein
LLCYASAALLAAAAIVVLQDCSTWDAFGLLGTQQAVLQAVLLSKHQLDDKSQFEALIGKHTAGTLGINSSCSCADFRATQGLIAHAWCDKHQTYSSVSLERAF